MTLLPNFCFSKIKDRNLKVTWGQVVQPSAHLSWEDIILRSAKLKRKLCRPLEISSQEKKQSQVSTLNFKGDLRLNQINH
jgi:hypothetical protein